MHIRFCHLMLLLTAVLAGVSSAMAADLKPAAPVITILDKAVVVSSITPGGKVLLFSTGREMSQTRPPVRQPARTAVVLSDDTHTGTVRYDARKPLPDMAVWLAVDFTSGSYALQATRGFEPPRVDLSGDVVKNDNAGQLRKIEWQVAEVEVVVARPGVGAWYVYAAKQSKLDENASNTRPLRLDFDSLAPIGDSPANPHNFRKGDVVALFDPRWLQYGVTEVGP
jgi:hypothetical protein